MDPLWPRVCARALLVNSVDDSATMGLNMIFDCTHLRHYTKILSIVATVHLLSGTDFGLAVPMVVDGQLVLGRKADQTSWHASGRCSLWLTHCMYDFMVYA